MIFRKSKKGVFDEIADDIFAVLLLLITFLFVFLLYSNTSKDSLYTYETSTWETQTTKALNQYLKYPLAKDFDIGDIIVKGDDFHKDENFISFSENFFKKYLGEAEWELICTYNENNKQSKKVIKSGSGKKTIASSALLPTEEGVVQIELRIESPRIIWTLMKLNVIGLVG